MINAFADELLKLAEEDKPSRWRVPTMLGLAMLGAAGGLTVGAGAGAVGTLRVADKLRRIPIQTRASKVKKILEAAMYPTSTAMHPVLGSFDEAIRAAELIGKGALVGGSVGAVGGVYGGAMLGKKLTG